MIAGAIWFATVALVSRAGLVRLDRSGRRDRAQEMIGRLGSGDASHRRRTGRVHEHHEEGFLIVGCTCGWTCACARCNEPIAAMTRPALG